MKNRLVLQNLYYKMLNEHLFTTIGRVPEPISRWIIKLNYGGRVWKEYPMFNSADGQPVLFIHIPKCGGTSIANSLSLREIRHLPASVFSESNPLRFSRSLAFSMVRDPYERLASILMHFRSSIFAGDTEKRIYQNYIDNCKDFEDLVVKVVEDRAFRSKLFSASEPGRSGFSVRQSDYLVLKQRLLVGNLFSLDRIKLLEQWLCDHLGKPIKIGHSNSSNRVSKARPSVATIDKLRTLLPHDYLIYDAVREAGGQISSGSEAYEHLYSSILNA